MSFSIIFGTFSFLVSYTPKRRRLSSRTCSTPWCGWLHGDRALGLSPGRANVQEALVPDSNLSVNSVTLLTTRHRRSLYHQLSATQAMWIPNPRCLHRRNHGWKVGGDLKWGGYRSPRVSFSIFPPTIVPPRFYQLPSLFLFSLPVEHS